MIRSLKLKNFQAWSSIELPLAPITVIIGETNAGKSSLLRALASVLFNAFEGQGMVRQGASVAEVELELEEGDVVRWARGNGVNRYMLNDLLLDKPGRVVPPAVQDALQIRELEFDGEVVRLQWAPQMDAPFLLSDSGAKATRMLGVAGNAAVVAQAARLAQQETRQEQDLLRAAETQLEQLTRQLADFADVDEAEPIAEALRDALVDHEGIKVRREALQELVAVQDALGPAKAALQAKQMNAQDLLEKCQRMVRVLETQQWMSEGHQVQSRQQAQQKRLVVATQLKDSWSHARHLEDLKTLFTDALALQTRASDRQDAMDHALVHLDFCREEHEKLVASMTCPTCGRVKEAA